MKITVTEEMREALRLAQDEAGTVVDRTSGRISLARLVAQAVEEAEQQACSEPDCARSRLDGSPHCGVHAEETAEERARFEADRKAGLPCGACLFVGGECAACEAEKEAGDA